MKKDFHFSWNDFKMTRIEAVYFLNNKASPNNMISVQQLLPPGASTAEFIGVLLDW